MTLREIIYDVMGVLYGGNPNDDTSITEEQIKTWIDQSRATLLRQAANAGKTIPQSAILLFCFEVELVDASVCCGWTAGCKILKSKNALPNSIPHAHMTDGIISVESIDGSIQFSRTTSARAKWDATSKFKGVPRYFMKDGYLYLTTENPVLKVVSVQLLADDPIAAMELDSCKTAVVDCSDKWDDQYPMPAYMVDLAVKKIVSERGITRQIPEDQMNNARED